MCYNENRNRDWKWSEFETPPNACKFVCLLHLHQTKSWQMNNTPAGRASQGGRSGQGGTGEVREGEAGEVPSHQVSTTNPTLLPAAYQTPPLSQPRSHPHLVGPHHPTMSLPCSAFTETEPRQLAFDFWPNHLPLHAARSRTLSPQSALPHLTLPLVGSYNPTMSLSSSAFTEIEPQCLGFEFWPNHLPPHPLLNCAPPPPPPSHTAWLHTLTTSRPLYPAPSTSLPSKDKPPHCAFTETEP